MRHGFEPRQAEEPAGSLDRVHEPKDVAQQLGVVRILLKLDQLNVEHCEPFVGLGQKFTQQVVHDRNPMNADPCPAELSCPVALTNPISVE